MKKLFLFLLIGAMQTSIAIAQNCNIHLPFVEGTELQYASFNKKNEKDATMTCRVIDVGTRNGEQTADVESVYLTDDKKDPKKISLNYEIRCKDGKFSISYKSLLQPQLVEQYEAMQLDVDGVDFVFPEKLAVDDTLSNASLTVKISSNNVNIISIKSNVTGRKVEAKESVTTPAGTFECFKIVEETETKVGFVKTKTKTTQWISAGVGVVKSETYDKKGKLESKLELTKFIK